MPPVTEILFGDTDGERVGDNAQGGPIVPIQVAPAGDGVTLVDFESSGFDYELIISADTAAGYNVYNEFVAAYGVPPADVRLLVTVDPGIIVSAPNFLLPAINWGNSWTGTPTFQLDNFGYIIGGGGQGLGNPGNCTGAGPGNGGAGFPGGNALELNGQTVTIDNGSGFIWGGGGQGGGGGGAAADTNSARAAGGGGGGGAGNGVGWPIAGSGTLANAASGCENSVITRASAAGSSPAGSLITQVGAAGGDGAIVTGVGTMVVTGGSGGAGGDYGEAGDDATTPTAVGPCAVNTVGTSGTGGAAGKAINLTGGTATFSSGSTSPNVKGAVS